MIKVKSKGQYVNAMNYLGEIAEPVSKRKLQTYAQDGVIALMQATPVDTGKTRDSWYYKITENKENIKLEYCNSNIAKYVPVATLIQYGHAAKDGSWVPGVDYINPAIQPIFEKIVNKVWKEVKR